jgi:putative FmdB family regulatory protein
MPFYEYRCEDCGHELEKLQKVSDPPLTDCPACQRPSLKKKVSAAGFRLKGGGWYETDFKKGEKQKNLHGDTEKAGGKPAETAKPADGTAKPAETKPAPAKPAAKADAA